jgi:hypothetical protein
MQKRTDGATVATNTVLFDTCPLRQLCYMRISTAALYAIAALAAKEGLQPAIAAAEPPSSLPDPDLSQADGRHTLTPVADAQAIPPQMMAYEPLTLPVLEASSELSSVMTPGDDALEDSPDLVRLEVAPGDREAWDGAADVRFALGGEAWAIADRVRLDQSEAGSGPRLEVQEFDPGAWAGQEPDRLALEAPAIAAMPLDERNTGLQDDGAAETLQAAAPTSLEFWQRYAEEFGVMGLEGTPPAMAPPERQMDPIFWAIAPQLQIAPLADAIAPPRLAQSSPSPLYVPDLMEVQQEQQRLQNLDRQPTSTGGDRWTPGLTIANPSGYGVDNWTPFVAATFQSRTRYSNVSDGAMVVGIGMGDARESVGVEVSYTLASFGSNRDFGTGGFNLRLHRRFSEDFSGAIGWNGFITLGNADDFESSVYGVLTKIVPLRDAIDQPFSRIAFTAGVGSGMFRSEQDVDEGNDTVGVFGSMALRIVEPVSLVTEWTGQDLAVGLSIAPFANRSIVITPALRDVAGAGDGARFVLGIGASF